jgi:putative copper resistance protein D
VADWLQPGLRFLHYALLLGLFGLTAFRAFGLRKIALGPGMGRGLALIACALLVPLVSAALMLVSMAEMMGQPVSMLDWATIKVMVLSTDLGRAFIARIAMLSLAALFLVTQAQRALPTAALFYGLALLTLAWNGHAAATEGTLGLLHRMNDGLHLLAVGLWIGAIGWFLNLVIAAHRNPDEIAPEPLLDTIHRFAPLGITLVAVVAATGLINAHLIFGLGNGVQVLTTDYGFLLAAKTTLFVLMLLFAARNASIGRQSARTGINPTATTLAALRASLAAELLLAAGVLAIVAFLGLASPMG